MASFHSVEEQLYVNVTATTTTTTTTTNMQDHGGPTSSHYYPSNPVGLQQADIYPPPHQDEENMWAFTTMSASEQTWSTTSESVHPQAFSPDFAFDRDYKNSRINNGQLTPPPSYDEPNTQTVSSPVLSLSPCGLTASQQPSPNVSFAASYASPEPFKTKSIRRGRGGRRSNSQESTSGSAPNRDPNREKFLERNRLAAQKCRQKRKLDEEKLKSQYGYLETNRKNLTKTISELRDDLLALKNEVLMHAQCGDEAITLHLSRMVKNICHKDSAVAVAATAAENSNSEAIHGCNGNFQLNHSVSSNDPPGVGFGFDDPVKAM